MRTPRPTPILAPLLFALALGLASCGGSTDRDTVYGWTLVTNLEGYVASDVPQGGVTEQAYPSPPLEVGEAAGVPASTRRGIARFDLAVIPLGFEVVRAEVYFTQYEVVGDPYGQLGNLVLDHVDPGAGLDVTDFAGGILTADVAVLSSDADLVVKWADVTGAVQADLMAGRTTSAFRLHFETDDDGSASGNYVRLSDSFGNPNPSAQPVLLVQLNRL